MSRIGKGARWIGALAICLTLLMALVLLPAAESVFAAGDGDAQTEGEAGTEEEEIFEPVSVELPFRLELTQKAASRSKTYTFVLESDPERNDEGEVPMPEQTVIEMTKAGSAVFGPIEFDDYGDYYYRIRQTTQNKSGETFVLDQTVYELSVHLRVVDNLEEMKGELRATVVLGVSGKEEKPAEVLFRNDYRTTPTPTPRPTTTPTPRPTTTPRPTPPTIRRTTPTPTPPPPPPATSTPAPPTPAPPSGGTSVEPEPDDGLEEIEDDEVPLASPLGTKTKTGEGYGVVIWSVVLVASAACICLLFLLYRKREKKDE